MKIPTHGLILLTALSSACSNSSAKGGMVGGGSTLAVPATLEDLSASNPSTEAMHLTAHAGKLYLGLGHWMQVGVPSAAQILQKPAASGKWTVFANYPVGRITALKSFAIASANNGGHGDIEVLVTQGETGTTGTGDTTLNWMVGDGAGFTGSYTLAGVQQDARAVGGRPLGAGYELYAGVSNTGIYRGTWDTALASAGGQTIHWSSTPELDLSALTDNVGKVAALIECKGNMYASIQAKIYRRNNGDGAWRRVRDEAASPTSTGYRGLTCLEGKSLLAFLEDDGVVHRLDGLPASTVDYPTDQTFARVDEQDIKTVIADGLGVSAARIGYIITAYNEFLPTTEAGSVTGHLAGVEWKWTDNTCLSAGGTRRCLRGTKFDSAACYVERSLAAVYGLHCLDQSLLADNADPNVDYRESFTAIRTIRPSPFAGEQKMYFGGYDANSVSSNGTAWVSASDRF